MRPTWKTLALGALAALVLGACASPPTGNALDLGDLDLSDEMAGPATDSSSRVTAITAAEVDEDLTTADAGAGDESEASPGGDTGTVTVVPRQDVDGDAEKSGGSGATNSGSGPGTVTRTGTKVVVGDGTAASCTSAALADAVRGGGDVSFNCGGNALTISLSETLKTCNTHNCAHPWKGGQPVSHMTLDGGGLITLSGGGSRGIFYANTCQESFGWLSDNCQAQTVPHVTFRNIGFTSGNASSTPAGVDTLPGGGGGGAIAMRGGQLTVQGAWFSSNRCMGAHSDAGGGAIRVTGVNGGATISNSRFSGNKCANGGAVSSLQTPLRITGSTFTGNTATGHGASSGKGGNGGAVYFDGTAQNVTISKSTITGNKAPEGGPAVFYVSNNGAGTLTIEGATLTGNTGENFHTAPYRSIFFKGKSLNVSGGTVK